MSATTVETAFTVETQRATFDSLALDCGVTLKDVHVAYETYGKLNAERYNAILVLHAFSGDAHAAGTGGWAWIAAKNARSFSGSLTPGSASVPLAVSTA